MVEVVEVVEATKAGGAVSKLGLQLAKQRRQRRA